MSTVECCESLSNSTKAKLQDAGVLYLSDLTHVINSNEVCRGDQRSAQVLGALKKRLAQRALAVARTAEESLSFADQRAQASPYSLEADALTPTPIENISFFTEEEVDEVFRTLRVASVTARSEQGGSGGSCTDRNGTLGSSDVPKPSEVFSSVSAGVVGCRSLRAILADVEVQRSRGRAFHATTFSRELDALLGGGVPVGGVTEVSGPPGVGKTQMLMQLAVSCAMPVEFGGLGGVCVFVDTEGSFVAERLEQMATAAVSLVNTILAKNAVQDRLCKVTLPSEKNSSSRADEQGSSAGSTRKRRRSVSLGTTTEVCRGESVKANLCSRGEIDDNCNNSHSPTTKSDVFTVETVLERVRYIRVTELTDFLAFLYGLPLWLRSETEMSEWGDCEDAASSTLPTSLEAKRDKQRYPTNPSVRMLLIDSVALPFRASDTFDNNASAYDDMYGPLPSNSKAPSHGALSKQGLWQRSRLLYQCSTALEELAMSQQLAVVVTNHMTTKLLRAPAGHAQRPYDVSSPSSDASGAGARHMVLVPALGDAWAHGLSTRLLLAFHHYELPSCAFTAGATADFRKHGEECVEDAVYSSTTPSSVPSAVARVVQHRVARLLKASGQPRKETCFLITSKGVRDVRKDMVRNWVTEQRLSNT